MSVDTEETTTRPRASQARHPWRATSRTVIAAAIALLPALPEIAHETGIDTVPFVASIIAITAMITRVLAIPAVDAWLDNYMPAIAAEKRETADQGETNDTNK